MVTTPKPQTTRSASRRSRPAIIPRPNKIKSREAFQTATRAGVDAIGTPQGRYRKRMAMPSARAGIIYVDERRDMITLGSVCIRFYINKYGKVEDVKDHIQRFKRGSGKLLGGCHSKGKNHTAIFRSCALP